MEKEHFPERQGTTAPENGDGGGYAVQTFGGDSSHKMNNREKPFTGKRRDP